MNPVAAPSDLSLAASGPACVPEEAPPSCSPAPGPARKEGPVDSVRPYCEENHFEIPTPRADPEPAGSLPEQAYQAAATALHTFTAAANHFGGLVPDAALRFQLGALDRNPPVTSAQLERAAYDSVIPGVPPQQVYEFFLSHPTELLGALEIQAVPATPSLSNGTRLYFQEPGLAPPVMAPVEVELIPDERRIRLHTLDGHPLRGVNEFTFESDGEGGTRVRQRSEFQESSLPVSLGGEVMAEHLGNDPVERQHQIWRGVHAFLADHAGDLP